MSAIPTSPPPIFTTRTISGGSITRPNNTDQYAAGDAISAVTTNAHFTFSNIVRARAGTILTATLHASVSGASALEAELMLYRTDVTATADNSAFAPSDSAQLQYVGSIRFPTSTWSTTSNNASNTVNNINLAFTDDGSSSALYGQLVARNAYTPAASTVYTVDLVVDQS